MSQKQPTAGVKYRIRNVDHGKYLEFPNTEDRQTAEGRDLLPTLKQQWTFKTPDPSRPTTYQIQNAAPVEGDVDAHFALSYDTIRDGKLVVVAEDGYDTKVVWRIKINETREYCTIVTAKPGQRTPTARLQMNRDETTELTEDDKIHDNQRWTLVPVSETNDLGPGKGTDTDPGSGVGTTSLPRDTYRIRTIDGSVALTVHAGATALKLDQIEIGPHQAWELIPKGGGEYEIKKIGQDEYLSWQAGGGGVYSVALSSSLPPSTWTVTKLGLFEYGIHPKITGQSLALTGIGNVNLQLKPTIKAAREQTWMIDTYKGFDRTVNPDSSDEFPRLAEIPDGKYLFQNNYVKNYATVVGGDVDVTARVPPVLPHLFPWWLEIQYESSTSKYFRLRSQDTRHIAITKGYLGLGEPGTLWYLFKVGSYYCICEKGTSPRRVWSGESSGTNYKWQLKDYYGWVDQMWNITKS